MSNPTDRPRTRTRQRIGSACSGLSLAVLVGLLTMVLGASPASAYWSSTGVGSSAGQTGNLAPPTGVTVPTNAVIEVAVNWTAGTGGVAPEGYYVTRYLGATAAPACASSPTALITTTSCRDLKVPDGDVTYVVTAVFRSWTASSGASSVVTVVNPARLGFVTQPTTTTAGVAITPSVVVTLLSAAGNPVASAGISITLAIGANPSTGSLAGTTTVVTAADGTATFTNLSIDRAGMGYTLVATNPDLSSETSALFTVMPPPPLGDASSYSVLAGAGVVNTLATTISGDLGVASGFVATGFGPGAGTVAGDIHIGDADAANALADFGDAYTAMRALTPTASLPGDLGGQTRTPGVYSTGAALAVTGILTLDAQGDPNAVFVFQVNAALNMGATGQIVLTDGAQAANVSWVINGAVTIGANSYFKGNILADGAITLGDSTELIGRAFATGAVTMADNTIRFTPALPPTLTITGGATAVTKDTTPDISGTTNAPVGTAIKVTVGEQVLTTTVQAGGNWTVTTAPLLAGSYALVVQVRDAAGNATKATQVFTVEVNPDPVNLRSAASFSVLAGGTATSGGTTTISGDLGITGPGSLLAEVPPITKGGALYDHDDIANAAQADLLLAINDAAGRRAHTEFAGTLGGRTFHIGVHKSTAAVGLTGGVTLDGEGNGDAVFIFQINGALTGAASCQVNLINGAQAANVFWVINGAAGTGDSCVFKGNILAVGAITLGANTNVVGRALSRNAVTLASSSITGATPRGAARFSGSARSSTAGSSTPTPPGTAGPSAGAPASSDSTPSGETPLSEPSPTNESSPTSPASSLAVEPSAIADVTASSEPTPAPSPSAASASGRTP